MRHQFEDNVYSCRVLFPVDTVAKLKKSLLFQRESKRRLIERKDSDSLKAFFDELLHPEAPKNPEKLRALWEAADEFLREKIRERLSQSKENASEKDRFDSIIGEKVLMMKP